MDDDVFDPNVSDDIPLGFSASIFEGNTSRTSDASWSSRLSSGTSFIQHLKQFMPLLIRRNSGTEFSKECPSNGDKATEDSYMHSENSNTFAKDDPKSEAATASTVQQLENISRKKDPTFDKTELRATSKRTPNTTLREGHHASADVSFNGYRRKSRLTRSSQKLDSQTSLVEEVHRFSSKDAAKDERDVLKSDSNTLQPEAMKPQSQKTKKISKWAIIIKAGQIYIEGYVGDESSEPSLIRTSCVTSTSGRGKVIITFGGSCYKLLGNMMVKASIESGVPINIAKKFLKGFPSGWRSYCKLGAKLNGSERGSYQGDNSSEESNLTRHLNLIDFSSCNSPPSLRADDEKAATSPDVNFSEPSPSLASSATSLEQALLASGRKGKCTVALTPVPEFRTTSGLKSSVLEASQPASAAVSPQSSPQKQKPATCSKVRQKLASHSAKNERKAKSCRKMKTHAIDEAKSSHPKHKSTRKQQSPKPSEMSPATVLSAVGTQRTRSGRKVKPVTPFTKLALEYQRTAQKSCRALDHILFPSADSWGASPMRKKKKIRKSAKALYVPNAKVGSSSDEQNPRESIVEKISTGTEEKASRQLDPKKSKIGKLVETNKNNSKKYKPENGAREVRAIQEDTALSGQVISQAKCSSSKPEKLESRGEKFLVRTGKDKKISTKTASIEAKIKKQEKTKRGARTNGSKKGSKSKTGTKRKITTNSSRKNKKSKSDTLRVLNVREEFPRNKEIIDMADVTKTRLRRRSYRVQITPLQMKEAAAKFLPQIKQQLEQHITVEKKEKAKKKGQKRAIEGRSTSRPKKRSREADKAAATEPPTIDVNEGTDNVFVNPDDNAPPKKKWTWHQKTKLKRLAAANCGNISWDEISQKLGFPPKECEGVYADMFRKKRKTTRKEVVESGPVEITAKRGTLRHRQQVRQNLETLKKPKFQDMFASNGAFSAPVDNMFSADLFSVPNPSSDFMPVTPNTKPPVGLDATVATPAWFKTPTSGNAFQGDSAWTTVATAETPAVLKNVFSPRTEVGDMQEKCKVADRVILQMQKKMMKGTLRELASEKVSNSQENKDFDQKKRKNGISFDCIKGAQSTQREEEEDSDMDEYFDAVED